MESATPVPAPETGPETPQASAGYQWSDNGGILDTLDDLVRSYWE